MFIGSNITLIALTINGEARRFEQPLNCRQLLDHLHLAGKRVALERNGEIVPRSKHGEQMLGDGDTLEIVVAVGGGRLTPVIARDRQNAQTPEWPSF